MTKSSIRVPGHELESEGAAMDDEGLRLGSFRTTGGTGRGCCSCGELSAVLDSATKRKAWHRGHKASIRAKTTSKENP